MRWLLSFLIVTLSVLSAAAQSVEVHNCGVGGNSTNDIIRRIERDVTPLKPELTILMVGTNDLLNSRKVVSFETYESNLTKIVSRLKEMGSDVVMVSSIPADAQYLLQRHDATKLAGEPKDIMARAAKIVKKIASEQGCYFIDMHAEFVKRKLPKHNKDKYIRNEMNSGKGDGVHPTPAGYELMGSIIFDYLSRHCGLDPQSQNARYHRIVCLGDSITNGGGGITGKNYPSYLNQKLNPTK